MLSFEGQIAKFRLSVFNKRWAQLIVIFVAQPSAVIGRFNPHNFLRRASVVNGLNVIFDFGNFIMPVDVYHSESQTRNFTSFQSV